MDALHEGCSLISESIWKIPRPARAERHLSYVAMAGFSRETWEFTLGS